MYIQCTTFTLSVTNGSTVRRIIHNYDRICNVKCKMQPLEILFIVVCFTYMYHSYKDNTTPLYMASYNGHHDVVQSLLAAGACVNLKRSDVSEITCTS